MCSKVGTDRIAMSNIGLRRSGIPLRTLLAIREPRPVRATYVTWSNAGCRSSSTRACSPVRVLIRDEVLTVSVQWRPSSETTRDTRRFGQLPVPGVVHRGHLGRFAAVPEELQALGALRLLVGKEAVSSGPSMGGGIPELELSSGSKHTWTNYSYECGTQRLHESQTSREGITGTPPTTTTTPANGRADPCVTPNSGGGFRCPCPIVRHVGDRGWPPVMVDRSWPRSGPPDMARTGALRRRVGTAA
jgi:hypothetical protein